MYRYVVGGTAVAGLVVLGGLAWLSHSLLLAWAVAFLSAVLIAGTLFYRAFQKKFSASPRSKTKSSAAANSSSNGEQNSPEAEVNDSQDLAELMLQQGRYTLLLRPQIAESIPPQTLARAQEMLDDEMTLVPCGDTIVGKGGSDSIDLPEHLDGRVVHVEGFYLDRYQVTNEQYQRFVDAGGYEQLPLWDPEIVPAILEFVDSTGISGPRYWKKGTYSAGQAKHPVVGVCWYEAAAYARWVGKRLPTDPEWVKSGSWPLCSFFIQAGSPTR